MFVESITVMEVSKPASLLVLPLGKALSGISPNLEWERCGWQLLSELVVALSADRRINMQLDTNINSKTHCHIFHLETLKLC